MIHDWYTYGFQNDMISVNDKIAVYGEYGVNKIWNNKTSNNVSLKPCISQNYIVSNLKNDLFIDGDHYDILRYNNGKELQRLGIVQNKFFHVFLVISIFDPKLITYNGGLYHLNSYNTLQEALNN